MTLAKSAILYADSNRGVYIPQFFAESFAADQWQDISESDLAILKAGPDHESYWDAWTQVLDNAETVDGGKLHQDGDLWVIYADSAIAAINAECKARLDYEESHIDAGDSYSHMPAESWCKDSEKRFADQFEAELELIWDETKRTYIEQIKTPAIDTKGVPLDVISTLALDNFEMRRGSIYGPYDGKEWISIESFPIGEIEMQIDLASLGVDGITWEYIKESSSFDAVCNDTETDSPLFYQTTDSTWFAAIKRSDLQTLIDDEANRLAD